MEKEDSVPRGMSDVDGAMVSVRVMDGKEDKRNGAVELCTGVITVVVVGVYTRMLKIQRSYMKIPPTVASACTSIRNTDPS